MDLEANVQQAVPFLLVADIQRSVRYYVDGLGFEMTRQWIDDGALRWCWLQHGGAALMLQESRNPGRDSWLRDGQAGQGVSICFQCRDALALYRAVTSRGISCKTPFVGNHMWDVAMTDPDGYKIHFESPTDVPEGIEYSE